MAASTRLGLTRLIERLQARLGPEQVLQLVLSEDHRPERSTAWQPALPDGGTRLVRAASIPATPRMAEGAALLTRPVWLLPQPLALPEQQSRPLLDGRPLQLLAGPERIDSGWRDGANATRDYFIAQAHDGALVWVYRERLPLAQPLGEGWYLHGRFG